MLKREEDGGILGILPIGGKVLTLDDRARCYVAIGICEAEYMEQRDIPLVGLYRVSLDTDEQGAVGLSTEITVLISSR